VRAARCLAALALAVALGACAMQRESAPPKAPPEPAYAAPPGAPPSPPPAEAAPAPQPAAPPADASGAAGQGADPLWLEFEGLDRALSLSTGDCAMACRALASLERAAKRVCESSGQLGEGGRCGEATKRLREARGRVRAACTRCPGGASTDPDAIAP
jgi:hypothetical protein